MNSNSNKGPNSFVLWLILIILISIFIIGIIVIYILPGNQTQISTTRTNVEQFGQCGTSTECVPGLICRDNRCIKLCDSNIDCGSSQYCNRGVCVIGTVSLGQSCNTTTQCDQGLTCLNSVCSDICTTILDCPNDKICVSGSCVSGSLQLNDDCGFNSQCPLDSVCRQTVLSSVKKCRKPCQIDLPDQPNNSTDCPVCPGCTETFCDEVFYVCRSP